MNRKEYRKIMKKKRAEKRRIYKKVHAMVARVYSYIKEEYRFMKMCNTDGCNIQPLSNCIYRASKATGISAKGVRVNNIKNKQVQKRSPTKILKEDEEDCLLIEDDEDCLLIEDERQHTEKRKTKVLSTRKRIVKKRKKDNCHTNTTEIEIDKDNSDSSIKSNSPSNEHLIEISESDKEEHETSSSSSESSDSGDEENLKQIVPFENFGADRNDQVNLNTASDNNVEKVFPSTSKHQGECNILPLSIKNSVQPSKRKVRQNLQRIVQFQNKETENSDQIDSTTVTNINKNLANEDVGSRQFLKLKEQVTENNRCVEFSSTLIKQEEFEILPLSNTYTASVDEGPLSSILECKAEVTENNEQVNANSETYYMIPKVGFTNPSINLEEYKVLSSFNTHMDEMDFNSDEMQLLRPKLDPDRNQDILEVGIDSNEKHVTYVIEREEYKILPTNKFALNVLKEEENEEEQEIDPLSNMKQDYYILEEADVSDTSVDDDLPSSSTSNLCKASVTKDIEFVCVNEASSDSSG